MTKEEEKKCLLKECLLHDIEQLIESQPIILDVMAETDNIFAGNIIKDYMERNYKYYKNGIDEELFFDALDDWENENVG